MRSGSSIGLVLGVFVMAALAVIPVPTRAAEGFSGLQGGFSVIASEAARAMRDFPLLESVAPVPSSFRPSEQSEISLFCEAEVSMAGKAVPKIIGKFAVDLYLLDKSTGRFEALRLGQERVKLDSSGYGSFYLNASTAPFVDRLGSKNSLSWFRIHGSFNTKKGDNAALLCSMLSA